MNQILMGQAFNDAMQANLGFVEKQASIIETAVYKIRYPELNYQEMIPVDFSGGEWAKSVTYYSVDTYGKAGWINGNSNDIPVVGMAMEQFETGVHTAGIGYDWGFEEINQARMLGVDLDGTKAGAARRAYDQMVYDIAFTGDTAKGFQGFYNYPGVPQASVAADGTGSSTLWSAKTGDLMARDVNALLIGLQTATKTTELADTLLLPVERLMTLATTRMGSNSDLTVLKFLQENNVYTAQTGQPLMIRGKRGMLTIGSGSTARMIAYRRSPEVLKLRIPMPHRFLPTQTEGLRFVRPGIFRLGGLDVRLPKAISYGDGI